MKQEKVGTFQAVVVNHDDIGDTIFIIDTRTGDQYHRRHTDGKMCKCNKIDEWEMEGRRKRLDPDEDFWMT